MHVEYHIRDSEEKDELRFYFLFPPLPLYED